MTHVLPSVGICVRYIYDWRFGCRVQDAKLSGSVRLVTQIPPSYRNCVLEAPWAPSFEKKRVPQKCAGQETTILIRYLQRYLRCVKTQNRINRKLKKRRVILIQFLQWFYAIQREP